MQLIVVEPSDYIVPKLEKLAINYGDELIIVKANKVECNVKLIKRCIISEFEEVKQQILGILKDDSVIFSPTEQVLKQTQQLSEYFGKSHHSLDVVLNTRLKTRMKEVWKKNGINTPSSKLVNSTDEIIDLINNGQLSYPFLLKPSCGFSSCGVSLVNNEKELLRDIKKIHLLNMSQYKKEDLGECGILVEEYISGVEYAVDTLWLDGNPIFHGLLEREKSRSCNFPDRLYQQNPNLSPDIKSKILASVENGVKATGITRGATHTELIYSDEKFYLIETTSRPGAGGIFYELFSASKKYDVFDLYYRIETNRAINDYFDDKQVDKKSKYYWYNLPYKSSGLIKDIYGLNKLEDRKEVLSYMCSFQVGDFIQDEKINSKYFTWVLGRLNNDEDIESICKEYDELVKIEYRQ